MQEIHRSHPQTPEGRAPHSAWAWPALIFGVLGAGFVLTLKSSVVWAVVFLLLGAVPFVWVTLVRRHAISPPTPVLSPESSAGYWQDWLAGWYWQTDAANQLTILKPDQVDASSWQAGCP
jgi:drug/metabolite transporter (DMT)-like permease